MYIRISAAALFTFSLISSCTLMAAPAPIRITADLTDAPRKLYHAEIDLPVQPGPVTLITPQWIPGNHRPTGPANDIVGVVLKADGKIVPWQRDAVNLYEFHLTVPAGVTSLHAHLDCIVTSRVSQKLAVLEWEKLLLYPANIPTREIPIVPSLKVPAGWGVGTALSPANANTYPVPAPGSTTEFAATNVEQLEDSPIITGEYFHEYALAPSIAPKHYLDVVSDYPEDSVLRPEVLAEVSNLVREADALYKSHHYNVYHFLLTLSDVAGGEGLEHGQSSDNGVGEKGFADEAHQLAVADLLSHEFTHSWNGKYRRPVGLYQPDFATAQQGGLLWVYEGMTQYLGTVLAARSGLETPAQFRDKLAGTAAELEFKPGRLWRSTEDTADAASILRGQNPAWSNWRRGQDYYDEGNLLWLDVDTLIRQKTDDKKSLGDFLQIFLGKGGNTGPEIAPYTLDELVADLNKVMPYDWAGFLRERVYAITPHADVAGIERAGYRLVFTDKPNAAERLMARAGGRRHSGVNCWYSLGLRLTQDGTVADVLWNGPADKAMVAPGYRVIAVDGEMFSADSLHRAIVKAKSDAAPIHLILQADQFIRTADIDYHDGDRFPALERIAGSRDYLEEITKPLTTPEKVPDAGKKDE